MDLALLADALAARGEPAFRARQVWERAARGAGGYEEMTSLPARLRGELAAAVPFSTLALVAESRARDGTVKALFRTADGHPVEAVLMRYADGRRSVCLSSQSGCPLACTFCATGRMRFGRNLTASEILDQALHFRREEEVDHAVFMGMGEPLLNLDQVLEACRRLPDLGVTHRRTAVSTAGWLPGLERFAEVDLPLRLALSLHAPDDALRSRLMPVNERFPLARVLAACEAYYARRRRRVFVEYVLLAGVNDRPEQARALARLLDPRVYKVNLIPYNSVARALDGPRREAAVSTKVWERSRREVAGPPGRGDEGRGRAGSPAPSPQRYEGSSPAAIAAFRGILTRAGLETTVRVARGRDIEAACGQLAADRAAVRA